MINDFAISGVYLGLLNRKMILKLKNRVVV